MYAETKLSEKYANWNMEGLYYEKQFPIGENGEKMALTMVDSCFLNCYALRRVPLDQHEKLLQNLDLESKLIHLKSCD